MAITKRQCPSDGKRVNCGSTAAEILSEGPKVVQNSRTNFLSTQCREPHQIDQRNVLNMKMYVGRGGGGQE